jgi:transcriptional regulator with XRE-family HTH domain
MDENRQDLFESIPPTVHYTTFGKRLREIRIERELTQTEFAKLLGTSKQILSRYELEQRSPKIDQVKKYAEKLNVSVDYLLGDTESEADYNAFISENKEKPFYKIFMDVALEMGLTISDTVRITGLTDNQVRIIIFRKMKDAPLPLALQLSRTLGVPIETWTGEIPYSPSNISAEAYEVARAYDLSNLKDRNTARLALNLEMVKE